MWEIYSLGSSAMLVQVMNAVAALCDPDAGLLGTSYIGLGFLIGLILVLFKKVTTAGEQGSFFGWFLVAFILYSAMFVPKVEVSIVDGFTGASTAVANVPMGVGVSGHIMSTIGRTLAVNFETAFATPAMTEGGFVDALEVLMNMRDLSLGPYNSVAGAVPGDVEKTIQHYISDCVIYDIEMPNGTLTWESLRNATSLLTAMEVNATAWFTRTYMPGGTREGDLVTCADAYTAIKNYLEDVPRFEAWRDTYVGPTKLKKDSPEASIDAALADVVNTVNTSTNFMLNSFLANQTRLSQLKHESDYGTATSALITTQAVEQRNVQWAAEETLFKSLARPLMTFVESFVYALTPIMAFLVLLGPAGISLVGKYLLLGLWVQLWMPVMAIVNLYINMAAASDFMAINASAELTSMGMLDTLYTSAQSYVATGGMLAAAVPALTLMLLYGSSQAMTHLAGRLTGKDHINEKLAAPDISNAPPAVNIASGYASNPNYGLHKTGADAAIEKFSIGQVASSAVASTKASADSAKAALTDNFGRRFGGDWGNQFTGEHAHDKSDSITGSFSKSDRVANSIGSKIGQGVDLGAGQKAALDNIAGAAFAGGPDTPLARAQLEAGLRSSRQFENGLTEKIMSNFDKNASHVKDWGAQMSKAIASTTRDGEKSTYSRGIHDEATSGTSKLLERAETASRAYQQTSQDAATLQHAQTTDAPTLGARALQNPHALNELNKAVTSDPVIAKAAAGEARRQQQADILKGGDQQTAAQRTAAANISALMQHAPEKALPILKELGFGRGEMPGASPSNYAPANENADLNKRPEDIVSNEERDRMEKTAMEGKHLAESVQGTGAPNDPTLKQRVAQKMDAIHGRVAGGEAEAKDLYNANAGANSGHFNDMVADQAKELGKWQAGMQEKIAQMPQNTQAFAQIRDMSRAFVDKLVNSIPDFAMGSEAKSDLSDTLNRALGNDRPVSTTMRHPGQWTMDPPPGGTSTMSIDSRASLDSAMENLNKQNQAFIPSSGSGDQPKFDQAKFDQEIDAWRNRHK